MADTIAHEEPQAPQRRSRWYQGKDVKVLFWIWVALNVVLLALSWVPAWLMGFSASEQMSDIKMTMTIFSAAAAPVAALIWALMLYSLIKWRYKGEGPPPDDAPAIENNTPTVLVWTLGSAILTLFVFVWGLMKIAAVPTLGGVAALPADAPSPVEVGVVGQQWAWNFTYPELGGISSNELILPVNHPANFEITSKDVIHSFWVVELGIKMDANRGAITESAVLPTEEGTYLVRCAELCGILHAAMQTQVRVVSDEEFKAWVAQKQSESPIELAPPEQEEGA